jgi:hypothetical protein
MFYTVLTEPNCSAHTHIGTRLDRRYTPNLLDLEFYTPIFRGIFVRRSDSQSVGRDLLLAALTVCGCQAMIPLHKS